MEICGKHNPTLVLAAQQTQTGRRWRSADGGWDPKAEWSYNVRPWKKVGIGALSENRFGDKSLGFQCGGGGRTNGGDRLGPRVPWLSRSRLKCSLVGALWASCCLLLFIGGESAAPGLRCMLQI